MCGGSPGNLLGGENPSIYLLAWGCGDRPTFIMFFAKQLQEAEQRPDERVVRQAPLQRM